MSAATRARKVGVAAPPDVGPANTRLAACVSSAGTSVPLVVIGEPVTVELKTTPSPVMATEVTVPVPATAHVPSPRQKVEEVAPVPLLRWVTARFPLTSLARSTAPNVGAPAALPC